jgi:hypothetical protein
MKINKQLAAILAVGASVACAHADTWSNTGASGGDVTLGQSGSSVFTFVQTGGSATIPNNLNTLPGFDVGTINVPFDIFSSLTVVSAGGTGYNPSTGVVTEGLPITVTVDWTVSPTAVIGTGTFITAELDTTTSEFESSTSGLFVVTPVSVPEPAQTVAGALILGCGGLVFAGRRVFKKQAA